MGADSAALLARCSTGDRIHRCCPVVYEDKVCYRKYAYEYGSFVLRGDVDSGLYQMLRNRISACGYGAFI